MKLTERENEVYKMLLQEVKQEVIALELGISLRTVTFHVANIKIKKNVGKSYQLILKEIDPTGEILRHKLMSLDAANDSNYNEPVDSRADRRETA